MHVYMYTCSCVYVHMYVGPEADVQCLPPSLPTLFIEVTSLLNPELASSHRSIQLLCGADPASLSLVCSDDR